MINSRLDDFSRNTTISFNVISSNFKHYQISIWPKPPGPFQEPLYHAMAFVCLIDKTALKI